jgi:hypothetical protein
MSFYFGGRTVEKVADMVERRKTKEIENAK